jgi:hypothetical protein
MPPEKASNTLFFVFTVFQDFIHSVSYNFPEILTDNEGSTCNAFGVATSDPCKGGRLNGSNSYLGYL